MRVGGQEIVSIYIHIYVGKANVENGVRGCWNVVIPLDKSTEFLNNHPSVRRDEREREQANNRAYNMVDVENDARRCCIVGITVGTLMEFLDKLHC